MTLIVADTGPLIGLSRIGQLDLLRELFGVVLVPGAVVEELRLDEGRPGATRLAQALHEDRWIRAMDPPKYHALPGLDKGESAAILLAEAESCVLLVDEHRARAVARKRGLAVVGTGRVLLEARDRSLVASIGSNLDALKEAGYRLSDALCARLLEAADEA